MTIARLRLGQGYIDFISEADYVYFKVTGAGYDWSNRKGQDA